MAARVVFSEYRYFQLIGHPGKRMPDTHLAGGECPQDVVPGQSAHNVRVQRNEIRVIVVHKVKGNYLPVYYERDHAQDRYCKYSGPAVGSTLW